MPAPRAYRRWRAVALVTAALTGLAATVLFLRYTGSNGLSWLDWFRALLVCLATLWIAWGAMQGLIGLVPGRFGRVRPLSTTPITTRTVILVPVYNEDPYVTFARAAAIDASLAAAGLTGHVDIVILSDSTNHRIRMAETHALARLVHERHADGRIFYRHRAQNVGRKAGNIEDFIRHSGGAYDFAIILDADSLMEGATIGEMIRRMEAEPSVGLLQSLPKIVNARTRFGRLLQFSAAMYGPVFARGLARMQGRTGPFWGHNAIVRITAFAESCGLPALSGSPPFGGHILSHDYVEAALLARAGWEVRVDPDLGGSFEEGPENLIAYAKRDRRWCQGNLQHSRLLGAPGLHGWNRFVFLQGIMSYVAPLIWGAFVVASLAAAAFVVPPNYFPVPNFSVPIFPSETTAAAISLFVGVIGLLLLPKLLIAGLTALSPRASGFGGRTAALGSMVAEVLLSSLIAPLLMMFQIRGLMQVLSGRDGGWPASDRTVDQVPFREAIGGSWWMVLTGLGLLLTAQQMAPQLFYWLLPVGLPLLFAPVLIVWTSQSGSRDSFTTPAETDLPEVVAEHRRLVSRWQPPEYPTGHEDTTPGALPA